MRIRRLFTVLTLTLLGVSLPACTSVAPQDTFAPLIQTGSVPTGLPTPSDMASTTAPITLTATAQTGLPTPSDMALATAPITLTATTPQQLSTPTITPLATPTSTVAPTTNPTAGARLPNFSHVYIIVMENEENSSIVGNSSAPYINSLISHYGLATNYFAIGHPSEPNYLALWSGSQQDVADDGLYNLSGTNVVDQLEAAGKRWKVFAQNVPLNCATGASASDGEDGTGFYVRKHEPAISFTNISGNATRCANITDFTHFDPTAANFEFIVPNMCNDMHECSIATGDGFLQGFVPRILNSPAWQQGGVLFLTWDEGVTGTNGGGHVATVVISNAVVPGFTSSTLHDHYSLLRTIENSWGLGCLNNTCTANDLGEFFH